MITGKIQGKFEEFDSTCKLAFICMSNYDVFNVESCSSGFDNENCFMCGNSLVQSWFYLTYHWKAVLQLDNHLIRAKNLAITHL